MARGGGCAGEQWELIMLYYFFSVSRLTKGFRADWFLNEFKTEKNVPWDFFFVIILIKVFNLTLNIITTDGGGIFNGRKRWKKIIIFLAGVSAIMEVWNEQFMEKRMIIRYYYVAWRCKNYRRWSFCHNFKVLITFFYYKNL